MHGSPQGRSQGRGYAETLGVEVPADLHGIAGLSLVGVVVLRTLNQQSILPLGSAHPANTLVVGFDEDVLSRIHKLPHFTVEGDLRSLHGNLWI